jgi:hypothetical protein
MIAMPPLPLLQSDTLILPIAQVLCPFTSLHFLHQIAREDVYDSSTAW